MSFELGGRRFYTLCVGEKGVFRFNLRAHGRAGHASVPALGDNALLKLAPLLEALRSQPEPEPTPEGIEFLAAPPANRPTRTDSSTRSIGSGALDPPLAPSSPSRCCG